MHPEIAKTLVAQHRDELMQQAAPRPADGPAALPALAHQLDPDRAGPGGEAGPSGQPRLPDSAGAVPPW